MSNLSLDFLPFSQQLPELSAPLSPGHIRKWIPSGDAGTAATLGEIQKLVTDFKGDVGTISPKIADVQKLIGRQKSEDSTREIVGKIVWGEIPGLQECQQKDYLCYAKNAYLFCRDKIKYVYDPHLVEYIERPKILLKNRIGDCDSKVITLVALWEAMGFESQFVTIKADADRKNEFSHIYCRVNLPKYGWIACDPTMPKKDFGWEPEFFFEKKYWHGSSQALGMPLDTRDSGKPGMFGMSGLACECSKAALSGLGGLGIAPSHHDRGHHYAFGKTKAHRKGRPFKRGIHGLEGGGWHHHRRGGFGWGGGYAMPYPYVVEVPYPVYMTDEATVVDPNADLDGTDPGYNVGPRGAMAMRGMGALGDNAQETTAWEVISGQYRDRLQSMSAIDKADAQRADDIFAAIQKMPQGSQRSAAQAAYDKANNALIERMKSLAAAKSAYNEAVKKVADYTGPFGYTPKLAGLGNPIAIAVVVGLIGIALLNQLSGVIGAWNGNKNASDGYMNQAASLVQQTGVTIEKTANATVKVATVAALGLIGFLVYQNRDQIQKLFKRGAHA